MIVLAVCLISAAAVKAADPVDNAESGSNYFVLSDAELSALSASAVDGDGVAAYSIALHFYALPDEPRGIDWLTISAENGDLNGMSALSSALRNEGGARNCRRSLFWLRKYVALQSGHDKAMAQGELKFQSSRFERCAARGKAE